MEDEKYSYNLMNSTLVKQYKAGSQGQLGSNGNGLMAAGKLNSLNSSKRKRSEMDGDGDEDDQRDEDVITISPTDPDISIKNSNKSHGNNQTNKEEKVRPTDSVREGQQGEAARSVREVRELHLE